MTEERSVLEDELYQRVVVNRDRRSGEGPLTVVQVGDTRYVWISSGEVGPSESSTVHLTLNGEPNGDAIFTRAPVLTAYRDLDETPGGIATASGPVLISKDWSLGKREGEVDLDLLYLGATQTFAARVTNLMLTTQNFVLIGHGVA